jgi:drug/metabolite transporter (DMT)-like permease
MKKAFIQLHVAVFLAGFTAILGKLITMNEGVLVLYRMLLTIITLVVLLYFRKQLVKIPQKDIVKIFSVGAIIAFHWLTFYGSIKYSNVSISLTCLSAIGFFTAFFEPLIMKRRVDIVEVCLGLIAIIGIYLIFDFHPQYKVGIAFGMISALMASMFPVYNKKLLEEFTPETVTFYEMCGGFLILLIFMPFYLGIFPAGYYWPTLSDWMWLVVLSWLCTVFAFILQLNALRKISPFTVSLSYNLEPIYGIILGFIIFHENKYLKGAFYWGLALIFISVVLQMIRVYYSHRRLTETRSSF